ncbi:hypothetical protein CAOG_01136 [Capsaspora owczarzaki ATCC 30864]|uniref:Nose resistant-to-fluoxetine protein N-terminal domain-containing protein n=1 Tax=Capsaspora owczarzaki (strain ATCC 30864) TaxID=595528 RepID=A0A0D2X0V2_CAPO3|nr:hypothetical protein CAOG_01136 [Capsaspora owczarzaki ATCC 30864]KJE89704.1 hypothetical protein CAOG_001136 [Capsaspora owczarzaki ATCC 30864]|eukprot:XP_004366007.1 hypothetical protein CAOG_01136 [Capsaspora owczarzaki ATCC 30864]
MRHSAALSAVVAVLCVVASVASAVEFAHPPAVTYKQYTPAKERSYLAPHPSLDYQLSRSPARHLRQDGTNLQCLKDLNYYFNMSTLIETGGWQYVDAMGKVPSGLIISLSPISWGDYDGCMRIPGATYCMMKGDIDSVEYKGMVYPNETLPTAYAFEWGVCVPASCDPVTLTDQSHAVLQLIYENTGLNFTVSSVGAYCRMDNEYHAGAIVMLFLSGVLIVLVLLATGYDYYRTYLKRSSHVELSPTNGHDIQGNGQNGETRPLLDAPTKAEKASGPRVKQPLWQSLTLGFSLLQNVPRMFATNTKDESLLSLNGIRVISMCWVVLGHTYLWALDSGIQNPYAVYYMSIRPTFQIIANGFFTVDSFFFLSGFLVCYVVLVMLAKRNSLPYFPYMIHRFLRITPTYMFALFFYWYIGPLFGDGPNWFRVQSNHACEQYWWANLLFVNDFVPNSLYDECMGWSWYLANDMQFYAISPIFLLLLYRRPIWGVISLGATLVVSFIVTMALAIQYDLDANLQVAIFLQAIPKYDYSAIIYTKPYCRIAPYIVGMFTAYILNRYGQANRRISRPKILGLFFIAASILLGIFFSMYSKFDSTSFLHWDGREWSTAENAIYITFARFGWSVGLAIIVWLCVTGNGGVVNYLLSTKAFMVFGRMTFCVYLIHPIVAASFFYTLRQPTILQDLPEQFYFIANTVISFAGAFVMCMFVEFPLANVEKTLLG